MLIGRKELTNLKRTTILTLFKVFKLFGIDQSGYDFNQQNNVLTFANGSQIFFLDLGYKPSDPLYTRLGGLELTHAFIDESNEVEYDGIEILKTRLGRRVNDEYGITAKLLETFNPDKGHVYRRYYKPSREGTLDATVAFVQALPTDNPHTPPDYIERLKRADKITRERLLFGNFEYDDDPTALIEYDAMLDIFTNHVEESQRRYMTIDVARFGSDLTVIRLWKGLLNYKTVIYEKQGIDATLERVKELEMTEKIPRSFILVDEDGVGGGLLDGLRGAKGFIANSRPLDNPLTKKEEQYQNLKTQCCYMLARYINERKIAIREDIQIEKDLLIQELEQLKTKDIDKDGKLKVVPKEDVKQAIGRSPDRFDALMMRMYFELSNTLPNKIIIKRTKF